MGRQTCSFGARPVAHLLRQEPGETTFTGSPGECAAIEEHPDQIGARRSTAECVERRVEQRGSRPPSGRPPPGSKSSSRATENVVSAVRCYVLEVKKPRVLEMTGRERMWMLASTVSGMVGAWIASKIIRTLFKAIRKRSPTTVFDPNSARFSWPDVVLWAAAGGIGLGIAKVTSARVATIGWEVATGTRPPGIGEESTRG